MSERTNPKVKLGDRVIILSGSEKENSIIAEDLVGTIFSVRNTYIDVKLENDSVISIVADGRHGTYFKKYDRKDEAQLLKDELEAITEEFKKRAESISENIKRLSEYASDKEYEDALFAEKVKKVIEE